MAKAKTGKQVLIAAKWILENYDWCKGTRVKDTNDKLHYSLESCLRYGGKPSCFCLIGAL